MASALLMANEDMLYVVLLDDLVINGKHGATGIAKQVFDPLVLECLEHHFGAGHLTLHCPVLDCHSRPFQAVASFDDRIPGLAIRQ